MQLSLASAVRLVHVYGIGESRGGGGKCHGGAFKVWPSGKPRIGLEVHITTDRRHPPLKHSTRYVLQMTGSE